MNSRRTINVVSLQPALHYLAPETNFNILRDALERVLADAPADFVVLPESFAGTSAEIDGGRAAEPAIQLLRESARSYKVNLIGGSIEQTDEDGKIRNTCCVFDRQGNQVSQYHKRKLFDRERQTRTPGQSAGIFEIDDLRIGLAICADLWFPELAREMVGKIDVLFVPIKSYVPSKRRIRYARRLWRNLALIRAMENVWPVVVSDWAEGTYEAKASCHPASRMQTHYTCGASCIVNPAHVPDIDRIQTTLDQGQPGVIREAFDLDEIAKFRRYRHEVGLLPED